MSTQTVKQNETAEASTPKVDLDKFAKAGTDPYVTKAWQMLSKAIKELRKTSTDLEKFTPPREVAIYEFLKSDEAKKNEELVILIDRTKELERLLAEARNKEHAKAKSLMQPESISPEELDSLRKKFNSDREAITGQLGALKVYTNTMSPNNADLLAVSNSLEDVELPRVPYGLGSAAGSTGTTYTPNPEIAEFKKWADANDVDYPKRGRISQDKLDAWKKATGK